MIVHTLPERRRRELSVAGLTATHAVVDIYQGMVPALIPFFVAQRHDSYAAASGIALAATLLSSIVQPAFGVLADRRDRPWLVPGGLLVAAIGVGLSGLGDRYPLTWSAIAVSGIGVAAFHPQGNRWARARVGRSATALSWFTVGGNIGYAVGPIAVTLLMVDGDVTGTPLLAIPGLLVAAALVITSRQARVRRPEDHGAATESTGRDDWRSFLILSGAVLCRSVCFFGVNTFLALYLIRTFAVDARLGSAAVTLVACIGMAGTVLGGRLADRRGARNTIRIGYVLIIPGLLGLLLAPAVGSPAAPVGPIVVVLVAVVVVAFGVYLPFSVQVSLGQHYLPRRIGTASGVTLGLAMTVGGLITPLLGMLADRAGLRAIWAVLLIFPLTALALTLLLPGRSESAGRE
ncbi:MFS transporter [Microlunatus soli]|uniref:MFS transporter n=1 Tax=Microlunatus soli TaxID=630515 RepID=UPI0018D35C1A|nr:MFS transporter [Microlunatus soli]